MDGCHVKSKNKILTPRRTKVDYLALSEIPGEEQVLRLNVAVNQANFVH